MKAVVIDRHGGNEQLHVAEMADPKLHDTDVLIRVKAAGVANWDMLTREGRIPDEPVIFPKIMGWEGAGAIEARGSAAQHFHPVAS